MARYKNESCSLQGVFFEKNELISTLELTYLIILEWRNFIWLIVSSRSRSDVALNIKDYKPINYNQIGILGKLESHLIYFPSSTLVSDDKDKSYPI